MLASSDSPRTTRVRVRAWWQKNMATWPAESPAPISIDVTALRQTGVAACRSVDDASADEGIDGIAGQARPVHAQREDDRRSPQHLAAVERDGISVAAGQKTSLSMESSATLRT
jgi:hypothetical protein